MYECTSATSKHQMSDPALTASREAKTTANACTGSLMGWSRSVPQGPASVEHLRRVKLGDNSTI